MASGSRHPAGGSRSNAISNMVVRVTNESTGRGPTQARTHESGDVITVILQDTLTKGERVLVAGGRTELVLMARKVFQDTMRVDMTDGIQEITGRRVVAFMSDNHLDPGIGRRDLRARARASRPGRLSRAALRCQTCRHEGGDARAPIASAVGGLGDESVRGRE
jgi:uncharacterized protein YbcI